MRTSVFLTALIAASHGMIQGEAKHCPACGFGVCDCSWANELKCHGSDGSCCSKCCCGSSLWTQPPKPGWELVWSDEFDACPNGRPDPANWGYEHGFVRNNEQQWYQQDNAACVDGKLVITARREHPAERPDAQYTSSSLVSKWKQEWTYGRFEMRAKIPIEKGSWPAWWVLGDNEMVWPNCGEVDIMEYYGGQVRGNLNYGDWSGNSVWNVKRQPVDSSWAWAFHTWAMEWNEVDIKLFLDGQLVNSQKVSSADGTGHDNPWRGKPIYMIINQAIGGDRGGDPSWTTFPLKYEVEYVRAYKWQKGVFV